MTKTIEELKQRAQEISALNKKRTRGHWGYRRTEYNDWSLMSNGCAIARVEKIEDVEFLRAAPTMVKLIADQQAKIEELTTPPRWDPTRIDRETIDGLREAFTIFISKGRNQRVLKLPPFDIYRDCKHDTSTLKPQTIEDVCKEALLLLNKIRNNYFPSDTYLSNQVTRLRSKVFDLLSENQRLKEIIDEGISYE